MLSLTVPVHDASSGMSNSPLIADEATKAACSSAVTNRRGVLAAWLLVGVVLLSACKQRDWQDRPDGEVDRPRPVWVDAEPQMPGRLAFGRGRNHFDDPAGQVRSPLQAEALARQSVAVTLKPAMLDIARMLVESLPQPVHPPGPSGPVGPDGGADDVADAPERVRYEREMRELISTLSTEIAHETARSAVVIDRWFDDATRTWHTLAASPMEESLFRMQLAIRARVPEAREGLLPAHACRVRLAGPRLESAPTLRRRDVKPALDDSVWPSPQPNEPGSAIYAGARVECGRATASAAMADQVARSRLAERVSRVTRATLLDWADATRRRDAWLSDVRADDIAAATGCDAAESAHVLTLGVDPVADARFDDTAWLRTGMGENARPDSGLPWYTPTALRPRVTRVLLEVPFDLVLARLIVRIRQAVNAGGSRTPTDGATGEDTSADSQPADDVVIPDEAQLRSMLATAQGRILGHYTVVLPARR